MRHFKCIMACLLISFLATSCYEGIDPISPVNPGPDATAPVIKINYPNQGTLIRVREAVVNITVDIEVTDDIELNNIALFMNGTEFARFNQIGNNPDFRDFRRALIRRVFQNLPNGPHTFRVEATDLAGKSTTREVTFEKIAPYTPMFRGEVFYMPFEGEYLELISLVSATRVGAPGFSDIGVKAGSNSYAGVSDSYLTFPTAGLLGAEFSASFWLKVNDIPDRAGVLTISAADPSNVERNFGFRFFRERAGANQRFKLNVGTGTTDSWFDGGTAADVDPTTNEWVHFAFTISPTQAVVYINGNIASQGSLAGVSWAGCDIISIMSGAPRFTGWGHLSDRSLMDELRLFNQALTQAEIQTIRNFDLGIAVP